MPPTDSLDQWVADALQHPIDFPSFSEAVMPQDRLAIALPALAAERTRLVESILSFVESTPAGSIEVIVASDTDPDDWQRLQQCFEARFPADGNDVFSLDQHDHHDRGEMAYLMADDADEPIYVAKPLADADLVLPVMVVGESDDALVPDGLFPGFVDAKTVARYMDQSTSALAHQIAWTIGIQLQLVIVTDGRDEIVAARGQVLPPVLSS